jgi:DNA uptake protein ComE-like DNA-binding protein
MKKLTLFILFLTVVVYNISLAQTYSRENQLDINNATLEEIQRLPVSAEIAENIYQRILYKGDFKSIYYLKEIEGIDQELLNILKPLIRIEPFRPKSSWEEKAEEIYYQLDRWAGNEGLNDTFIDLWIEKALDPMNVNNAEYDDLINLQNISPVDAVSIVNYRTELGTIRNARELRGIPGLSYYGYRNASRFLDYSEPSSDETVGFHGHLTTRLDNTPFLGDEEEAAESATVNYFGVNALPNIYYKMRFTYNRKFKFGYSYTRYLYEPNFYYNESGLRIPKGKFYLGVEDLETYNIKLKKLYIGNYSVSIGQGVIMENTDFFTPRKSGYGFRKRFNGISGDNSRTRQYALKGFAAEIAYDNFNGIVFGSFKSRDAILNTQVYNESRGRGFNQFIVLDQRFEYSLDDERRDPDNLNLPWRDTVKELTYGGHLQYNFFPGTYLGATYYESAYDRPIEPIINEIVASDDMDRLVTADTEIQNSYGFDVSKGTNPFWDKAVSFRRVYGFDFQTVIENIAIQGEWGELDKGGSVLNFGDDPRALVLSLFAQWDNLNILALYRNYDLGYDNPFQRSFSNYRRYKGTIYEDYYYLQSALYGQLYANNPQPQSEEGIYINSYYQINRQIRTRMEYDNWTRKADRAKHYRLVGTVNYHPVFPLRIQLRQKWQAREGQNDISTNFYKNTEFRGMLDMRLSGFDRLSLFYVTGGLFVHPRPRVFGDMTLNGEALGARFTHNFNQNLKLIGTLSYYKGFFWSFEDTQFMIMNSMKGAIRTWWSLYARLNNNFSMRLKYTIDHQKPIASLEDPVLNSYYDFRRKVSNLFYIELNYNF